MNRLVHIAGRRARSRPIWIRFCLGIVVATLMASMNEPIDGRTTTSFALVASDADLDHPARPSAIGSGVLSGIASGIEAVQDESDGHAPTPVPRSDDLVASEADFEPRDQYRQAEPSDVVLTLAPSCDLAPCALAFDPFVAFDRGHLAISASFSRGPPRA